MSFCLQFARENNLFNSDKFIRSKEVNYKQFKEKFLANYNIEDIESWYLWQEIHYLIKGNSDYRQAENNLISLENYSQQIKQYSFLPPDIKPAKISILLG